MKNPSVSIKMPWSIKRKLMNDINLSHSCFCFSEPLKAGHLTLRDGAISHNRPKIAQFRTILKNRTIREKSHNLEV